MNSLSLRERKLRKGLGIKGGHTVGKSTPTIARRYAAPFPSSFAFPFQTRYTDSSAYCHSHFKVKKALEVSALQMLLDFRLRKLLRCRSCCSALVLVF